MPPEDVFESIVLDLCLVMSDSICSKEKNSRSSMEIFQNILASRILLYLLENK